MISPTRYNELKALGYSQEYHGIPMYKIFYSIIQLHEKNLLATASRISRNINKYPAYCHRMLDIYWNWNYVSKKTIKRTKDKTKKADGCSFHWILTKSGMDKLRRLREEFGEMIITDT